MNYQRGRNSNASPSHEAQTSLVDSSTDGAAPKCSCLKFPPSLASFKKRPHEGRFFVAGRLIRQIPCSVETGASIQNSAEEAERLKQIDRRNCSLYDFRFVAEKRSWKSRVNG